MIFCVILVKIKCCFRNIVYVLGMLRKTAGKIYINGKETNSRSALKNSIGLCTQHNLFFPDLTVREHLEFFAMVSIDHISSTDLHFESKSYTRSGVSRLFFLIDPHRSNYPIHLTSRRTPTLGTNALDSSLL